MVKCWDNVDNFFIWFVLLCVKMSLLIIFIFCFFRYGMIFFLVGGCVIFCVYFFFLKCNFFFVLIKIVFFWKGFCKKILFFWLILIKVIVEEKCKNGKVNSIKENRLI